MIGPYLEQHEMDQLNQLLESDDTIAFWIATRINGVSVSMAYNGNISTTLLNMLDEQIKPILIKDN